MKKIISMLLVLSVIFSFSVSAGAYSGKNLEAPKAGEVVIDGDLSEWDTSKCLRIDSDSQIIDQIEHWDGVEDCSVELYAMWDEENLYIAMKILDDTPLVYREGFPLDELDAVILFLSTNPDADPDRTAYEATDWRLVQSADKYKDEYDFFNYIDREMIADNKGWETQGEYGDEQVFDDYEAAIVSIDGGIIWESKIPLHNFSNDQIPQLVPEAGKSPETFQAHPGQEIEPYLQSGMLLNLNQVWDYANLSERALPGLEQLCTASDGNKYIVPIGIHKSNVIFYNIHVFEELGIEIPDHEDITWDEFWSLCDQLAEKMPEGSYPIDLGDRKGWPASQVFEDIMLGTDPQIYEDFINGNYNVEDVTKVLATYAKLMDYVAPDHSSRDWYEASGQVVAGTYAMQIMGAWMQPLMTSMGQEYGKDYGIFTFPGTEGWFGMCIDGFVVSNDSADVNAGVRWAYNVSTPEVQTSFSALKESISPYSDTPDDTYCELTLKFKNQLMDGDTRVYPSFTHGTALPWSASTSLQTQIQEFATSSDHDAEYFANKIVNVLKEASVKGDWNLVD